MRKERPQPCKTYTQEEVDLLNLLTKGGTKKIHEVVEGAPEVDVSKQEVEIDLPGPGGMWYTGKLLNLQDLGGGYFISTCLVWQGNQWQGKEKWCLKLDDITGFKPLFLAEGWL